MIQKKLGTYVKIVLIFGLLGMNVAEIPSAIAAEGASRTKHRLGLYTALLGDPFPSLFTLNLAYNLFSFLRVNAGYGSASVTFPTVVSAPSISMTTLGGGVKLFVPNWGFSPVVGLNYSKVTVSVTGTLSGQSLYGISGDTNFLYTTLGFDWQTGYGLNFGFGYNLAMKAGIGGLPFVQLGWFF
jgi:hypothetical protein